MSVASFVEELAPHRCHLLGSGSPGYHRLPSRTAGSSPVAAPARTAVRPSTGTQTGSVVVRYGKERVLLTHSPAFELDRTPDTGA